MKLLIKIGLDEGENLDAPISLSIGGKVYEFSNECGSYHVEVPMNEVIKDKLDEEKGVDEKVFDEAGPPL